MKLFGILAAAAVAQGMCFSFGNFVDKKNQNNVLYSLYNIGLKVKALFILINFFK